MLEVTIESHASGGLRVIEHLPPQRPCRLEGQNGVGKSAFIRLLTLASGKHPYPLDLPAWRSLKSLIGPSVITIKGLNGAHSSARLSLTPERWPSKVTDRIGDWLGDLQLDGTDAPTERLFEALDVVHLVGTERLLDTLTEQFGHYAMSLRQTRTKLHRLEDQRAQLGELHDELQQVDPRVEQRQESELRVARRELKENDERLDTAKGEAADLLRVETLLALIESDRRTGRVEQLEEIRTALAQARALLAGGELDLERAVKALDRGNRAQREIAKLENQLTSIGRRIEDLESRQEGLADLLEAAGVSASADQLDDEQRTAIHERLKLATGALEVAQQQAMRRLRSEDENAVFDELRIVLASALDRGLPDLVLCRFAGKDVTVRAMHTALLAFQPTEDLDPEDVAAATASVAQLKDLLSVFETRPALREEESRVRDQLGSLSANAISHDALQESARDARARRDAAAAEVKALNHQLGTLSRSGLADVEDVQVRAREILEQFGIDADAVPARLSVAQTDLLRSQQVSARLREQIQRLSDSAVHRRLSKERVRQRIREDDSLDWVAALAGFSSRTEAATGEWTDQTWRVLLDNLAAVRTTVASLVEDVEGLEEVAESERHDGRLGAAMRTLVEDGARSQLSARPISEALFDFGSVDQVSLENQSISWTTAAGEPRTRPLNAFSSGEQALGFLRARLEQVAEYPSQNRLIFLDEFGAFIAADRRRPLADLLTGQNLASLGDQVVVVLPLQADYANELDETTGELHALYARRATAISERGYFTEVFDG